MNMQIFYTGFIIGMAWNIWGIGWLRTIWPYGTIDFSWIVVMFVAGWVVIIACVVIGALTWPPRKYRLFTLDWVKIHDEEFDLPDMIFPTPETESFKVPRGTKEFWVSLEDTDNGKKSPTGDCIVYNAAATYHLDFKTMRQHSNDDLLHVRIEPNGMTRVIPCCNYRTESAAQWEMSEERSE